MSEPTTDASELTSVTLLTATGASNHTEVQKLGERGQAGLGWDGTTILYQRWSACKGGGSFENSNQCWGFLKERVPCTSSGRTCHQGVAGLVIPIHTNAGQPAKVLAVLKQNSDQCWGFLTERIPSTSSGRTCHPKNNHLRSGCFRGTCCKSWRRFGNTYCVRTYD